MGTKAIVVGIAFALVGGFSGATAGEPASKVISGSSHNGVRVMLWQQPQNIAGLDMIHGSGGAARKPVPGFTFVKEDTGGSTPKFTVRDSAGVEWRVKLGSEARAETAATRFLWAMGYYTDDDYIVRELVVENMQPLQRGQQYVEKGGLVRNARLERSHRDARFLSSWRWKDNPFVETREMNGLLVLMAMMNNWDLKDSNTTIYLVDGPIDPAHVYLVGDVGATFGRPSYAIPSGKANADAFEDSRFITRQSTDSVNFHAPARAPMVSFFFLPHIFNNISRSGMRKLTRNIPRQDARWMGDMLIQLTDRQIRDAFESSGFDAEEVELLTRETVKRISQLSEL